MIEERVVLENESGFALMGAAPRDVGPGKGDRAFVGEFESGNDPKEGGFAGAAGSEKRDEFAGFHDEARVADGGKFSEEFGEVVDGDAHGMLVNSRIWLPSRNWRSA